MATSLSVDLRRRVVAAAEGGMSRREAAARIFKWVYRARSAGWRKREKRAEVTPRPQGGDRRSQAIEAQAERILALIVARPDSTLEELKVSLRGWWTRLQHLGVVAFLPAPEDHA